MKYWFLVLLMWLPGAHAIEQLQNTEARNHQNLNGQWSVIVDPFDVGDKRQFYNDASQASPSELLEYNFDNARKLSVPGDWNTQGDDLFFYEGTVWYQRDLSVDKSSDKKYLLHFGAVNYLAHVYLNGELLGQHEGGFTPFQFDVTDTLVDGHNTVVVKVNNRREPDYIPTMSTDWWNYGGITRPVKLVELERRYVSDYTFEYIPGDTSTIRVTVETAGDGIGRGQVQFSIPELDITTAIDLNDQGVGTLSLAADPTLWTPSNPKLYETRLAYEGALVKDKIGFRHVEIDGTDILLNGESVFLRGISLHEEMPYGPGRAWSEEHARTLLTWVKELGSNYVRLAHYPHNEAMVRMADELGLLVWAEIPVYWDIQFESEAVYQKAEQQFKEMLTRDKNRASIILWSIANETPNNDTRTQFLSALVDSVRALDPTRLITAAINTQSTTEYGRHLDDPFAEKVDVVGINAYCGWYEDAPKECAGYRWVSDYEKPIIFSEFGGGALQGFHGDEDEVFTEANQAMVYRYNLEMLDNLEHLRGVSPWILKDFLSPRRPLAHIQDYWNRKGLLSETGIRKKAWYVLRDWYQEKSE